VSGKAELLKRRGHLIKKMLGKDVGGKEKVRRVPEQQEKQSVEKRRKGNRSLKKTFQEKRVREGDDLEPKKGRPNKGENLA